MSIRSTRSGLQGSTIALLATLSLMLVPALASAHPGHTHSIGDGRIPGQPDFERRGETVTRYNPLSDLYEIRSPGKPVGLLHADKESGMRFEPGEQGNVAAAEMGPSVSLPSQQLAPICRNSGNRIVVLYGYEGLTGPIPTEGIRNIVRNMNWKIADQASQSSGGSRAVRMAVECDGAGQIVVHPIAATTFDEVMEEAPKLVPSGTGLQAVKFLTFVEADGSGVLGVGGPVYQDSRKNRQNVHAVQQGAALIYHGSFAWYEHVTIHELMHALGASQGSVSPAAPFATTDSHCSDGQDALCSVTYGDAYCPTSAGYGEPATVPIDCNKNTYFNASPPAGSWLATYWNVAGIENPFLATVPAGNAAATTSSPTSVTGKTAVLNGTVTPNGDYSFYQFQYGTDTSYGSVTPSDMEPVLDGYGTSPKAVSRSISNLEDGGTVYHYRVVAKNDGGQLVYGADKTFKTLGPRAVTEDPTEVVAGKAVFNGTLNPNGVSTKYGFCYGPETQTCQEVWSSQTYSGTEDVHVSLPVSGLKGNTKYAVEMLASSDNGYWDWGAVKTFATPDWTPKATTLSATDVKAPSATLRGTVNGVGFNTSYQFEYGTTTAYGSKAPASPKSVGATSSDTAVSEAIGALKPQTTYHYRVAATTAEGTVYGQDQTFTTLPIAVTLPSSKATASSATLNGIVNPAGSSATYQFEYGTTTAYGSKVPASPLGVGSGSADVSVSQPLSGLAPRTTYHFRLVATNAEGTTLGKDETFTTWGDWSAQTTPNPQPPPNSKLTDVSCPSATACFAVGRDAASDDGIAANWSGGTWTLAPGGEPSLDGLTPKAVTCPTTEQCWSIGQAADGSAYVRSHGKSGGLFTAGSKVGPAVPSGATKVSLNGISCSAATACTIVGSYVKEGVTKALIERYNGIWSVATPADASATPYDVSCPTTSFCLAVGIKVEGAKTVPYAEKWNGTSWSTVPAPIPAGMQYSWLTDISCASATACMALGETFNGTTLASGSYAARWDGTAISLASTGIPTTTILSDVACTAANSCLAVGTDEGKTVARFWGGTEWAAQTSPTPSGKTASLTGISCSSATACTAVGRATSVSETGTLGHRYQ